MSSHKDAPGIRVLKKRRMNQPFTKYLCTTCGVPGRESPERSHGGAFRCGINRNFCRPWSTSPRWEPARRTIAIRSPTLVVGGVWISEDTQSKIGDDVMIVGADTLRR